MPYHQYRRHAPVSLGILCCGFCILCTGIIQPYHSVRLSSRRENRRPGSQPDCAAAGHRHNVRIHTVVSELCRTFSHQCRDSPDVHHHPQSASEMGRICQFPSYDDRTWLFSGDILPDRYRDSTMAEHRHGSVRSDHFLIHSPFCEPGFHDPIGPAIPYLVSENNKKALVCIILLSAHSDYI